MAFFVMKLSILRNLYESEFGSRGGIKSSSVYAKFKFANFSRRILAYTDLCRQNSTGSRTSTATYRDTRMLFNRAYNIPFDSCLTQTYLIVAYLHVTQSKQSKLVLASFSMSYFGVFEPCMLLILL